MSRGFAKRGSDAVLLGRAAAAHRPAGEFFNGAMHPPAEHAGRVDAILPRSAATETPGDLGLEPLLRVHSADYLDFLRTAHEQWRAAGREGDAFPYTFPSWGAGR